MTIRLAVLIISLCSAFSVTAEPLTVITDEWPPYNFQQKGKIVGISTELVEATLQDAGYEYEIKSLPWKRALVTTQKTPLTMMFTTARTSEREDLFKWVGPIHKGSVYLYKLKENSKLLIGSFEDIKRHRVAVLRGGAVESFLKNNGINEKSYIPVSYSENLIPMLFAGRVDLIPGDELDLLYQLSKAGYKSADIEKAMLLYQKDYYIALNKEMPDEIVDRLQDSLNNIIYSEMPDQVIRSYILHD